jgi:hypothetical protein
MVIELTFGGGDIVVGRKRNSVKATQGRKWVPFTARRKSERSLVDNPSMVSKNYKS